MNKPDGLSKEICRVLRLVGCKVTQIASASGEKGIPDLLVSYGGAWFVAEIKMPKGILSTEQVRWHAESQAPVHILRSTEDAIAMLSMVTVARPDG